MPSPNIFVPGPSSVFHTVEDHIRSAFRKDVPSISHRSSQFKSIFEECVSNLRLLLGLPDHYHVLFTGSATEIWERIIQNCIESRSAHVVNGSFSHRFFEITQEYHRQPRALRAAEGTLPELEGEDFSADELLAVIHNETSTGVSQPLEEIYALRRRFPQLLIAVDAVSSLPYVQIDYHQVDTVYFSVQKGFGLPAGLGVWLVNERCHEKAKSLVSKGLSIGSYHSLPSLIGQAEKNQTPETPNVLGIYLLAKVAQDMLDRGVETLRKETEFKAGMLYYTAQNHPKLRPFVQTEKWRSKTVIVAEVEDGSTPVIDALKAKGLTVGAGYGSFKSSQIRIANFPAHSKEQMQLLIDALNELN
ncbi:MAG: alanine--glyoxylate aminotransferase family protein [Cytophagales bacterium]|nr:alanine--glyoxylate aminotransferase family protein [Cytophagales bacterium]